MPDGILPAMIRIIVFLLLCFAEPLWAQQSPWVISALDWAKPRTAQELIRDPTLAPAIRMLVDLPQSRLEIHYPGGDEGSLWASELRGWLIALAIDPERIELVPGASQGRIELRIAN